jgi:D-alanine-D-alanine ligase
VLVLMHTNLVPPERLEGYSEQEILAWKAEFDVVTCLRQLGHEVRALGVQDELLPIRDAVEEWRPHIVFNLLEEFHWNVLFDHNVVSFLELLRVSYTGCNPRGMILARSKALSKKILHYHRIATPQFAVFPLGRRAKRPPRLGFPLIVKSLLEHASLGIAQSSVVDSDQKLAERVAFIHESVGTDAIAEEYIDGRELYVGVLGNGRLQSLPVWELCFDNMPANALLIATAKVKHDVRYQKKRGIRHQPAGDLSPELCARIASLTKRIYRVLEIDGCARIDFRLTPRGELYFVDANPNPDMADGEEFAAAAAHAGLSYGELLERILQLGLHRGALSGHA